MNKDTITNALSSQYRASLAMLRHTLIKIPDNLWNTTEYKSPCWKIAYHILWATKLYLGPNIESYTPFEKAIVGAESLGGKQDWENSEVDEKIESFHTKEEIFAFIDYIEGSLQVAIDTLPLDDNSGFEWYPYSRLELHINNIRHIQHHTAQLIERLKAREITGFLWWGDQNEPQEWL